MITYTFRGELSTACQNSLTERGKVQGMVRDILAHRSDSLDIIATEMGLFRDVAQTKLDDIKHDKEAYSKALKEVNNVINDVSRICREEVGKSIVLKSRKGGYVYHAVDPNPRVPAPTMHPDVIALNIDVEFPSVYKQAQTFAKQFPVPVMAAMFKEHGTGENFAEILKDAKQVLDNEQGV